MSTPKTKAAGAGERGAAFRTNYAGILTDIEAFGKIPIEHVQIAYLFGPFEERIGIPESRTFAIYAESVNLLREGCTCEATAICPVCRAWTSTERLNRNRRATL